MEHLSTWLLGGRMDIEFALGFLLALWVTVHALLRKREVASAAGWIGLSWFAPFLGSVLYFLLGINRVQRRAQRHRPRRERRSLPDQALASGGEMAQLQEGVGRITQRQIVTGNSIRMFQDGDAAYQPMLDAIAAARQSVGLSSYIFNDDEWGGRFIAALSAAHRRGVAVRVLIDGVGGGYLRSPAYHHLRREGVPAARFLHSALPWRMPFVNLRSHKKVLVIDGAVGFTGGMNIADANVMATRPKDPVQDTHFRLEGPIVGQLAEDFLQDWAFTTDESLDTPAWLPDSDSDSDGDAMPARTIDAGPDSEMEKIEFAILQAVACAETRITVMTPYFLPDDRLITALALAAMRGVAVDVVIPERSDQRLVDWATRTNIGPLLTDGVRLWLSPPPFRHSKMMVVDSEWCLIGSSNWDVRSFRLNFELCVELYDKDLAQALTAHMERCRSRPLLQAELEARSFPIRLRDAAARLLLPYI